ncbi:MAG: M23 family metallopeptidase [Frankiaceae bacterium]|nr:M23 family metallopeptidase [Frankiaceae bacterium]
MVGALLVVGDLLALAGPVRAADPAWVWPLTGPPSVSRPFDPPATRYGPGHRGADLTGSPGQVVRAAGDGRVSYAGLLAGRGVLVVVHGDLRTTYEPVTATVRVGQQVTAGQAIGRLAAGHPGCPATCLHWGLRRGEAYLDPVRLVRAGPSRLLPVDDDWQPAPAPTPVAGARAHDALDRAAPDAAGTARPADDPAFALRGADAAWGSGALAALVAGLVLLLRPRRPPDGPAAPPLPVGPVEALPAVTVTGPTGRLVDLAAERNRRRPEVA